MTEPTGTATQPFRDLSVDAFSEKLASSEPVPGGGSASAVAAALGASLVTMVARLSTGRPKYVIHEGLLSWAIAEGERLRNRFLDLADEDARAYAGYSAALKLPKETDEQTDQRRAAIAAAAREAAEIPLACVEACVDLVRIAEALAGRCNMNASSDLDVAALLADAAAHGAAANVLVNLPSVGDPAYTEEMTARVTDLLGDVERIAQDAHEAVGSGETRDPLHDAG